MFHSRLLFLILKFPILDQWEPQPLEVGFCVLLMCDLTSLITSMSLALESGIRYPRLIVYISCPKSGISYFFFLSFSQVTL